MAYFKASDILRNGIVKIFFPLSMAILKNLFDRAFYT